MEIRCVLIELKPNSLELARQWASFIQEHRSEALSTLKAEGVTVESIFFTSIGGKDYLIGYMRAKSFAQAAKAVEASTAAIDAYHQQFKNEAWVKSIQTQPLIDLCRIDNETEIA